MARNLKRSEQVARDIVRATVARGMEPGSPLPTEASMVKQYDVSRGTLREALRILEVYGLITIKPGPSGGPRLGEVDASDFGRTATFYYEVTGATFGDLAEARLVIEPTMARLAAQKRTEVEVELMAELLVRTRGSSDVDELVQLSLEFHDLVGQMSRNKVLALIGSSFEEIFTTYSLVTLSAEENREVLKTHEKIASAIANSDAAAAERWMRRHMESFVSDFEARNPAQVDKVVDWT